MNLSHDQRPLVYIAGPYSHPDPVENSHNAIMAAERLDATGLITPVVPHLSLLWHAIAVHTVDFWYDYDLALLAKCAALMRLPGDSIGAEKEVLYAKRRNIPAFYSQRALLNWAKEWSENV